MYKICTEYIQCVYRVYTVCVQSIYSVCTEYIECSMYRVYTVYVQSIYSVGIYNPEHFHVTIQDDFY